MTWLRLERALSYCVAEGELDKGRFHRRSSNLHGLGESRRFRRYASRPSQPKFSQAAPQRFGVESQQMRGPLLAIDSPFRPFQHLDDVVALKIPQADWLAAGGAVNGLHDREQHLVYGDLGGAGKNNGAFDHILKLTHVAGPVVGEEPRHRLWIKGEMCPLELAPDLRQEMLRKQGNVFPPIP